MRVLLVSILGAGLLTLSACGNDKPATEPANDTTTVTTTKPGDNGATPAGTAPAAEAPKSGVDHSTAQGVVDAFFAAARASNEEGMLACFAPESVEEQKTSKKAFTHAIISEHLKLTTAEAREPVKENGDQAEGAYRAVFTKDGKEDKEGMRFKLVKKSGSWWIVSID